MVYKGGRGSLLCGSVRHRFMSVLAFSLIFLTSYLISADQLSARSCNYLRYRKWWGPAEINIGKWVATKWKLPISYFIFDKSKTEESKFISDRIVDYMTSFSAASGIVIDYKAAVHNVAITIANDIIKENEKNDDFYRGLLAASGFRGHDIDMLASLHNASVASWKPRCGASRSYNLAEGVIGAFVYIQSGQKEDCALMSVAELFGIDNIRGVLLKFPSEVTKSNVDGAIRELYDERIRTGMNFENIRQVVDGCI